MQALQADKTALQAELEATAAQLRALAPSRVHELRQLQHDVQGELEAVRSVHATLEAENARLRHDLVAAAAAEEQARKAASDALERAVRLRGEVVSLTEQLHGASEAAAVAAAQQAHTVEQLAAAESAFKVRGDD